jgi:hypothetical protein
MEIAYPITCGESKAILLWKKFVCPGINVKCVKVIVLLRPILELCFLRGLFQCLPSLFHQIKKNFFSCVGLRIKPWALNMLGK